MGKKLRLSPFSFKDLEKVFLTKQCLFILNKQTNKQNLSVRLGENKIFFILEGLPAAAVIPPLTSQGPRYHKHNIPRLTGNQKVTLPFNRTAPPPSENSGEKEPSKWDSAMPHVSKSYTVFAVPEPSWLCFKLSPSCHIFRRYHVTRHVSPRAVLLIKLNPTSLDLFVNVVFQTFNYAALFCRL